MRKVVVPTSMFKGSELARTRSRVATASRLGSPAEVEQARRDHAAVKLESYVNKVVSEAPPLTDEQISRITAILRPTLHRAPVGGGPGAA